MKRQRARNFLLAGPLLDRKSCSSPIINRARQGLEVAARCEAGERATIHSGQDKEGVAFRRNQ